MLLPKDIDWLNGLKKTRPIYMLSTRHHLRPRDTYRLKLRDGKRYSMQMEIKRKLE